MCVGEGWVWIGPSACDKKRREREREIEDVWGVVVGVDGYVLLYSLFAEALDLFREALSCYQNGAFLATVLLCGVSLEAAVYKVAAMKNPRICGGLLSYEIDQRVMKSSYGVALCTAKCHGFISEELETRINNVRGWRNYAAHYVQRLNKKLCREIRIRLKRRKKGEKRKSKEETLVTWVSKEIAAKVLRETAEILKEIIEQTLILLKNRSLELPC